MTISISVPPTLRFMLCDASWHSPPPRVYQRRPVPLLKLPWLSPWRHHPRRVLPRRQLPLLNLSDSSLRRHQLVSFPSVFCNSIVRIPSGLGRHRLFEELDSLSSSGLRDFSLNNTIITELYSLKAELWSRELVARRVPQRNVLSRDERIFQEAGMMTGVRTPVVLDWQLGPRRHEGEIERFWLEV